MADPAAADPAAEDAAERRGPGTRAVPGPRHLEDGQPDPARVDARAHQRRRAGAQDLRAQAPELIEAARDAARCCCSGRAARRSGGAAAVALQLGRARRPDSGDPRDGRRRDAVTLGAALLLGGCVWLASAGAATGLAAAGRCSRAGPCSHSCARLTAFQWRQRSAIRPCTPAPSPKARSPVGLFRFSLPILFAQHPAVAERLGELHLGGPLPRRGGAHGHLQRQHRDVPADRRGLRRGAWRRPSSSASASARTTCARPSASSAPAPRSSPPSRSAMAIAGLLCASRC